MPGEYSNMLRLYVNQISKRESVQRRFTKRIAGLRDMPYVERLKKLQLESLETRRLRNNLLFTYKVLFGLASVDWSSMFLFNLTPLTLEGTCLNHLLNSSLTRFTSSIQVYLSIVLLPLLIFLLNSLHLTSYPSLVLPLMRFLSCSPNLLALIVL